MIIESPDGAVTIRPPERSTEEIEDDIRQGYISAEKLHETICVPNAKSQPHRYRGQVGGKQDCVVRANHVLLRLLRHVDSPKTICG